MKRSRSDLPRRVEAADGRATKQPAPQGTDLLRPLEGDRTGLLHLEWEGLGAGLVPFTEAEAIRYVVGSERKPAPRRILPGDRTMYEPGVPEQDVAGGHFANLYLLGEIGFENFGEGGGVGS